MEKKGLLSLGQLAGIVLILVLIGIMLTVGLKIESDIQTSIDDKTTSLTLTNSTTNYVVSENSTGTVWPNTISKTSVRNCALTVTHVTLLNGTGATDMGHIASGNYTTSGCYIYFSSIKETDAGAYNNSLWNITGSARWSKDTAEYNATESAMEGITNVAENQGLLGTIIIFGVIISVVVVAFMVRGGL